MVESHQPATAPPSESVGGSAFRASHSALGRLRVQATTCIQARSDTAPADDACDARPFDDGTFMAVVADGLGGAKEGRAAALKTCATYAANFRNRPRAWSTAKTLEEITRHLNRQLHQEGLARFEAPELATTVAVVVLEGDRLHLLNLGDSRIYRLRRTADGSQAALELLSRDHRQADQSHVLTQAMGLADAAAPRVAELMLAPGDTLLLCTDGLSDVLDEATLAELLRQKTGARGIVATARGRATPETLDDITAVVLDVLEIGDGAVAVPVVLPVLEQLTTGGQVDGFTLRQSFRVSDRIWLAAKAGKSYVLKFAPLDARTNDAALTQFIREMWHATSLKADFFPAASVPEGATTRYYALEYFHAPTLRHWLDKHGPLPTADAVALAKFLLAAEQFLLRHGFVHADLKPENILVLGDRDALTFKLIDLGSVAEVFSVTSRAGTPSYLAPERFFGMAVSETTELFALGVTLYEAVTRHLPYGEVEPFQTPTFRAPKRPTVHNLHLPAWLEAVILRALAVKPEDRYANYSEMLFDLEHPARVKPFRRGGGPLFARNPQLALKLLLLASLVVNALLLVRLLSQK